MYITLLAIIPFNTTGKDILGYYSTTLYLEDRILGIPAPCII